MYVNELRAYYPRPSPRVHRTGLKRFQNMNIKTPSPIAEGKRVETGPVKHNRKLANILLKGFHFFNIFMKTSSIGGLNHLVARKRHTFEYVLWFGTLAAAIYGFVTISLSTLSRYHNNPTVITVERNYKDWNTTLPAATICPEIKYNDENLNNYLKRLNRFKSEKSLESAKEFLDALAKSNYSSFNMLTNFTDILPTEYLEAIVEIRHNIQYSISSSNFDNEYLDMQELVMNINELNLCHSYNSQIAIYLNPLRWKSGNYSHPSTTFAIMGSPLDGDIFTQVANLGVGYTVYLHSPQEVPDIASKGSISEAGTFRMQDVSALSISSSPEIQDLTVNQRKCRFPHETDLKISPVYSYNLCRMECRLQFAHKICGCVPYFYKPSRNAEIY